MSDRRICVVIESPRYKGLIEKLGFNCLAVEDNNFDLLSLKNDNAKKKQFVTWLTYHNCDLFMFAIDCYFESDTETVNDIIKMLSETHNAIAVNGNNRLNSLFEAIENNNNTEKNLALLEKGLLQTIDEYESVVCNVGSLMSGFGSYISDTSNYKPFDTGLNVLNNALGGGLFPKVYIVGGESSVGKTAFVLNIVDNVAKSGEYVLYFSLEMMSEELIARSISRHTFINNGYKDDVSVSSTENDILSGYRYICYPETKKFAIKTATNDYLKYSAEHINIYTGRKTMDEITSIVKAYCRRTKRRPFVVVDYLQIITQPENSFSTERDYINYCMDSLKEIREKYKCPVLAISSYNRVSYVSEKSNASFKGSGEIEYTADCVMALELTKFDSQKGFVAVQQGSNKGINEFDECMVRIPRDVRLKLTKNRGGVAGAKIQLLYNQKYNLYEINRKVAHTDVKSVEYTPE